LFGFFGDEVTEVLFYWREAFELQGCFKIGSGIGPSLLPESNYSGIIPAAASYPQIANHKYTFLSQQKKKK